MHLKKRLMWLLAVACTTMIGSAFGAIPTAGVITGCYLKSGGTIRVVDPAATTCKSNETTIEWNVQGPMGAAGATGATGATGSTGATGPQGPSDAYVANEKGSFAAIPIHSGLTTILTLPAVPPGNYVIHAVAAISGPSTTTTTECGLLGDVSPLSVFVQVTTPAAPGFTFSAIPVDTAITLAVTTDIKLSCLTSGTDVVSQPSVITAIRVATLH